MAPLSNILTFAFIVCLVGKALIVSSDEELQADIDKLQNLVSLLATSNVKLHGKVNNISSHIKNLKLDRKDLPMEMFLDTRGKNTLLTFNNQRMS